MDEEEYYELMGFVLVSTNRKKILNAIREDYKMPSEIAKELDMSSAQVSFGLSDLKKKKLVRCLNENVQKGRLYVCTPLGMEILKKILKKIG